MSMNNDKKDTLDNLITQVSQAHIEDNQPSIELNNILKAKVREKEALMLTAENKKQISLWYLPMILNIFVFTAIALMSQVFIQNRTILQIVIGICAYLAISGIVLTLAGMKFSTLKTAFIMKFNKGGTLA